MTTTKDPTTTRTLADVQARTAAALARADQDPIAIRARETLAEVGGLPAGPVFVARLERARARRAGDTR